MAAAKYTWQIAIVVRILIDIMNNVIKRKIGFVNFKLNIPKYLFRRYVFSHLPLRPAK